MAYLLPKQDHAHQRDEMRLKDLSVVSSLTNSDEVPS